MLFVLNTNLAQSDVRTDFTLLSLSGMRQI